MKNLTELFKMFIALIWIIPALLSCDTAPSDSVTIADTTVYIDTVVYEDTITVFDTIVSPLPIEIYVDGSAQPHSNFYLVSFLESSGGYLINLIDPDVGATQVESIIIYPDLIFEGIFELDNTIQDRLIKGILRVPIDETTGTSFSFLNQSESFGVVQIDSIVNDKFYGNFNYTVHHPSNEEMYDISGEFNGVPMNF